MADTDIEKLETEELFTDDSNEVPPSDIVAYNELRSCADLVRMYDTGILDIQPEFQRDQVWPTSGQTRFIDSLTKQLPIPSMCFAYDFKQNKWQVIDGLQRISTIVRFLGKSDWRLSTLDDIDPALSGKSTAGLQEKTHPLHQYYLRVQNQSLPINVLRCDFKKKAHTEYLFTIFHRLNSGGIKLNNQEIRNCIFGGQLNSLLKSLDGVGDWRHINSMKKDQNYRFAKQEIILRFFAFYDRSEKYKGQISKFLNEYMFDNREPGTEFIDEKRKLFERVVKVIRRKVFPKQAPSRVPVTILEALLVGVASNVEDLEKRPAGDVADLYKKLIGHESVSAESLAEGLSKKDKVQARLAAAKQIFGG